MLSADIHHSIIFFTSGFANLFSKLKKFDVKIWNLPDSIRRKMIIQKKDTHFPQQTNCLKTALIFSLSWVLPSSSSKPSIWSFLHSKNKSKLTLFINCKILLFSKIELFFWLVKSSPLLILSYLPQHKSFCTFPGKS